MNLSDSRCVRTAGLGGFFLSKFDSEQKKLSIADFANNCEINLLPWT